MVTMTTDNIVLKQLRQERSALADRIASGIQADNGHYEEWQFEISLLGDLEKVIEWCCRGAAADHSARLADASAEQASEDDSLPF